MPAPLHPYYVVPLLVEQPTWGGEYIAEFKGLTHPDLAGRKIGQSFELMAASRLVAELSQDLAFGIAYGAKVTNPEWHGAEQSVSLSELAEGQREAVYGSRVTGDFATLIKFTQALNNSYQVHIKPGTTLGHWQAKPESWYYFEAGLATLGLKAGADPAEYQRRSHDIDSFAQTLSAQVKSGQMTLETARQQLADFIAQDHPNRFVNTVEIKAGQVVDLSQGGIHHSWEKAATLPLGNIVYEVQIDVLDENCTLRSFDQGNIKDDGSVRPLSIDEYFQALDTNPSANQIEQYLTQPQPDVLPEGEYLELFTTPHYRSYELRLQKSYQGEYTSTKGAFHHLFSRKGSGTVVTESGSYPIKKGVSLFIPAGVEKYQVVPEGNLEVVVTTV